MCEVLTVPRAETRPCSSRSHSTRRPPPPTAMRKRGARGTGLSHKAAAWLHAGGAGAGWCEADTGRAAWGVAAGAPEGRCGSDSAAANEKRQRTLAEGGGN